MIESFIIKSLFPDFDQFQKKKLVTKLSEINALIHKSQSVYLLTQTKPRPTYLTGKTEKMHLVNH